MLISCFLSSFVEFRSAVSEEKSRMPQPIRGQGGHFVFPIGPKNTNLVQDVEILFLINIRISFSGFRGEVENVSANQRPGRPFCFSGRPEKHKLGRGRWNLTSYQVSFNFVQQFQRRSRKSLSKSEARAAILFFPSPPPPPPKKKNTNMVEDVDILLPVKFRWIPFSGFIGEVENVSANQRLGRPLCFSDQPEKKHKLGRGRWNLASYQVLFNSVQRFQRRSRKCLSQSEARAAILFSDRPEKHKLGRGRWDLAFCQISLNSVQRFQRRSRKCLSQSEARAVILFFRSARKHKLGRGRWDLAFCQVSLNFVRRFQRRSRKCLSLSEARAVILYFRSARKTQTW